MLTRVLSAALVGATVVILASVLPEGVWAQQAPPAITTQDQVLAACASTGATEAACKAAIAAYFTQLELAGIVGADLEAAIAALVVALVESGAPPDLQPVIVAAIEDIGTNYATGEQGTAILEIAQMVEEGNPIETSAIDVSGA